MLYYRFVEMTENMQQEDFTQVDIDEFFESDEKQEEFSTELVVLSESEAAVLAKLIHFLKDDDPNTLLGIMERFADMERLVANITHFPSLLERQIIMGETRTQHTLIEGLLAHRDGDKMLHLPSKAILGKGFLVTKYHTFISMYRIAVNAGMPHKDAQEVYKAASIILFTIMAEDVYLDLLDEQTLPLDIRQEIAYSLIVLWEHRYDHTVYDAAPVLQAVWEARRNLAPAFGTMVGTSELLLISIQMDENWTAFLREKLSDKDVSQAMEEFLFGLSYEQIQTLRTILRERGIAAIGRDEISTFLEQEIKIDVASDLRDFYMQYPVRRDNARVRKRLQIPGPHHTLEDHYMRFILERNKEKQQDVSE